MKFFEEYLSNYDMLDPDINYKYYHSYRVMNVMELLATKLKLSKKDIYLAKIIGLYHDIGRFEQDKLYNSFKDDKMDHGLYGVKILKENKVLSQLDIDSQDYETIYQAIANHNKFTIEKNLKEREQFFSKLIRDADKLDILYSLGEPKIKKELRQDESKISHTIEKCFFNNIPGNIKDIKSKNDSLIINFGYIYDINFKETLKIIKEENYYDKIFERINHKDIFIPYINHTNKYIEERMK